MLADRSLQICDRAARTLGEEDALGLLEPRQAVAERRNHARLVQRVDQQEHGLVVARFVQDLHRIAQGAVEAQFLAQTAQVEGADGSFLKLSGAGSCLQASGDLAGLGHLGDGVDDPGPNDSKEGGESTKTNAFSSWRVFSSDARRKYSRPGAVSS